MAGSRAIFRAVLQAAYWAVVGYKLDSGHRDAHSDVAVVEARYRLRSHDVSALHDSAVERLVVGNQVVLAAHGVAAVAGMVAHTTVVQRRNYIEGTYPSAAAMLQAGHIAGLTVLEALEALKREEEQVLVAVRTELVAGRVAAVAVH